MLAWGKFRFPALMALLVVGQGLAPAPALGQQRQQPVQADRLAGLDTLMLNFDRMAFGDEGERPTWIAVQRWRQPVRAILIGDGAEAYRDDVRSLFAEFAALTGVSFTLTDGDSQANLRIFLSQREWYRSAVGRSFPRPESVVCFTTTTVDSAGTIGMANTVIPEDLSSRVARGCLVHELMHAIGFQGHPLRAFDSALRNGVGTDRLTVNDRLLIRALYDDRLRADMTSEDALAVASHVVADLLARVQSAPDAMEVLRQHRLPVVLPPWNGGPV